MQEAGKHKCEKYWTDSASENAEETFGKYSVALLKSREICPDFLVRTMRLRWRNGDSVAAGQSVYQHSVYFLPSEKIRTYHWSKI